MELKMIASGLERETRMAGEQARLHYFRPLQRDSGLSGSPLVQLKLCTVLSFTGARRLPRYTNRPTVPLKNYSVC